MQEIKNWFDKLPLVIKAVIGFFLALVALGIMGSAGYILGILALIIFIPVIGYLVWTFVKLMLKK